MVRLSVARWVVAAALLPASAAAQGVGDAADALRNNAVRITTAFDDGTTVPGFGIILREAGDTLYIVTARHIVVSEFGARRRAIAVGFADRDRERLATFVRADDVWDLALLAVPRPPGFHWLFRRAIGLDTVGTRVGIIGRDGRWLPTGAEVAGQVTSIERGEIIADFAGAQIGVSGGPLVGGGGILGMVHHDAGNVVYAYHIENIRRLVLGVWQGVEELDPPDFPFAALALLSGFTATAGGIQPDATDFPPLGLGVSLQLALSPLLGAALEVERAATQSAAFQNAMDGRTYEYENRFARAGAYLTFHSRRYRDSGEFAAIGVSHLWLDPHLRIDDGGFVPLEDYPDAPPVPSDRAWAMSLGAGLDRVTVGNVFFAFDITLSYTTTPYMNITIQDPFAEQTGRDWIAALRARLGYMIRPDQSHLRILRY